jgi:hypothetical protein
MSCKSEEFWDFYENEAVETDVLCDKVAVNVIRPNRDHLRAASQKYYLDILLYAMLEHAPHPLGRRYVAIALCIAKGKGQDAVINVAKAWMDYLFIPSEFLYLSFYIN